MLALTSTISRRTRTLFKQQQEALGALNGHVEETVSGIQAVKAFGRERRSAGAFAGDQRAPARAWAPGAQIWTGFLMPMMNVIGNLAFAAVAVTGGVLAARGTVTVGVVATFIFYSRQFVRPLNEIANTWNTLMAAVAGAERVFEVIDETEETPDLPGRAGAGQPRGARRVPGRVASATAATCPCSTTSPSRAPPGSVTAIVGRTGAGKTTIVNLLARFYETSAGSVLVDGVDVRRYRRASLRRAFGVVLQDGWLFAGTVRDNILYGRPDATEEEMRRAAALAGADHGIERLAAGYDTVLAESGANLSQGQRQLIAIARAVLASPALLVLDEATSSVDARTELHIQLGMIGLMRGRTSFIIAHRLSTIRDADTVLVVDDGRIVERGSPAGARSPATGTTASCTRPSSAASRREPGDGEEDRVSVLSGTVEPDVGELLDVILRRTPARRVHHVELFLDGEVKDAACARLGIGEGLDRGDPLSALKRDIDLHAALGHDMFRIGIARKTVFPTTTLAAADTTALAGQRRDGRAWQEEHAGPIQGWKDFEAYPWPTVADVDLSGPEWLERNLRDGMGWYELTAHVFEMLSFLLGYETLCYAVVDQPDLVDAILSTGRPLLRRAHADPGGFPHDRGHLGLRRSRVPDRHDDVAGIPPDEDPPVAPALRRDRPREGQAVPAALVREPGRDHGRPGRRRGHRCPALVRGRRSCPSPRRSAGTASRVACSAASTWTSCAGRARGRSGAGSGDTLDACLPGGGYCLGTGNTVANYVPLDNYLAMVDEGRRYPDIQGRASAPPRRRSGTPRRRAPRGSRAGSRR